ncbi:MAG: Trk system potassium transporter TrkA [Clostridia bacterium]|nr:Trk system potassium transporter TrkA [Clostridia bacterium]
MNIIIAGVGKIGGTLVENFVREKHDVIVIDIDRNAVEKIVNEYDVKGVIGGGLERDILDEAGITDADMFIACTNRDEMNILSCVLAKKLGAKNTVARVRDPEYFKEMENMQKDLGLDLVFNPERRTAIAIENLLKFPAAINIENFASGKAVMAEFILSNTCTLVGKTLIEVSAILGQKVLFGMVQRENKVFIPRGDFVLQAGDVVHVIGPEKDITAFFKQIKLYKHPAKSVLIVGGGKVSYYLASILIKNKVDVKIIEQNEARCVELSELIPETTVICGDGTDQSVLEEESFKNADALVSLTGFDEGNVMISLYATQKKVDKVITKVDRASVMKMVKTLGLGTVVSPQNATADHIIGFVRANKTDESKGINTFYKLNDNAEALEFVVGTNFKHSDKPLKELKVKKNALIGAIVRGDKFILPAGDTTIHAGDKVIIVTTIKGITELKQVFK